MLAVGAGSHAPHQPAHHASEVVHPPAHRAVRPPARHPSHRKPPRVTAPRAPVAPPPPPLLPPSTRSGISTSLTTDKSTYNAGDRITISLTEANTSNAPVTIESGPSVDGFSVTQNGATVWRSNAGIQPMFIQAITLQPGQSHTFTSVWNGLSNSNASSGGVIGAAPVIGTLQVNANFPGPTVAPVTITIT
jgi:Intracellular proteinase inhibitor